MTKGKRPRERAGHALLRRFVMAVSKGEHPQWSDLQMLAGAFAGILEGNEPKKALAIGGRQHEGRRARTETEAERELRLALDVQRLRAGGMTRDDAINKVAGAIPGDPANNYERVAYCYRRDRVRALQIIGVERALLQPLRALERSLEPFESLVRALERSGAQMDAMERTLRARAKK